MKCRICGEQHYHQTYYEPEEPCICGHGLYGESPWQYAKWRGILAWFRYSILRPALEWIYSPIADWCYKPWKY